MRVCFLAAIALFAMAGSQQFAGASTVLFTDGFAYPDGPVVGQGPWVAHSGAGTNSVQVSSGTILLNANGEDVSAPVGAVQGPGEIWTMSFDVIVNGIGSGATYFAHLKNAATGFNARVFGLNPVSGGDFTFGIGDVSGTADASFATDFSFGVPYTVNAAYNFDTGLSTLTVDGVIGSISSTTPDTMQLMEAVAFRQATAGQNYTIDNVSLTAIPEPSSIALLAVCGLGVVARRRKR